ncbi:FecR family protein [Rhodohalobacter sp. 614A]|uniref:FecR family protein n=1 Tax=Rhodohalobacter sp. 614A TaxID=2908649 RepID=UPI001F30ADF1|nr:FecR domain-containing protein [Rhodohalobacter sp. 614A]
MDVALLVKYLSGHCSRAEQKRVENWLKEDRDNRRYLAHIKRVWDVEPKKEFKPNAQKALDRVEARLGGIDSPEKRIDEQLQHLYSSSHKSRSNILPWLYVAASILILAMATLYVAARFSSSAEQKNTDAEIAMQEIITKKGQRTTFRLKDGSRVVLNADSKIRIPADYGEKNRELYLAGDAYFEVYPDADRPFIVYSKNTFTQVLGTKFAVLTHPTQKVTAVVEEGKVAFGRNDSTGHKFEELTQNEVAEIYEDGNASVFYKNDLNQYLGWKDGLLIFESTPFNEVVSKLERWYNIDIKVPDSTSGFPKLTAEFSDEPMGEVLNVVAATLHLRYIRDGDKITFINYEAK